MSNSNRDAIKQVLAEGKWLQRLALCLAHDQADADDIVQETWLAALRAAPDERRPMRPWLAHVLRNAGRKLWRHESRRRRREITAAALLGAEEVASTDTMLARLELQRMIAAIVRDLDEPYRTVILLRFFEGRSPADMAISLGVPAGTVRWRLNEGLRRVREQLDAAHGGNRQAWRAVLLLPPLASPAASLRGWATRVAGVALVPALVAGLLIARPERSGPSASVAPDRAASLAAAAQPRPLAPRAADGARMSQLVGTVVPALIQASEQAAVTDPWPSPPVCNPADNPEGCAQTIPREQLPRAAEAGLVRLLAGRQPEKLRIEPKIRKGHTTYKARFEVDGVDEEIDLVEDGRFIEHQVHLTPTDLPTAITAAATAALPEARVVKATMNNEGDVRFHELVDGRPTGPLHHRPAIRWYGVRLREGDKVHDLKFAEDGRLLEHKRR